MDEYAKFLEADLNLKDSRINRLLNSLEINLLNDFTEENNQNIIIEKDYNKITIENLSPNGVFVKPKYSLDIKEESNFSFEYNCDWIEGIDDNSFSFYWGKDILKSNYFSFGISGNGYFYLANKENGIILENDADFFGWKYSNTVNKNGKNHIEVRRYKNCLEFYINKELVHKTTSFKKFYGNEFGFIVFGIQTKRFPIKDMSVPTIKLMMAILNFIDLSLSENKIVYVHCWGGVGSTGTVVGCYLIWHGLADKNNVFDKIDCAKKIFEIDYP